MPVNTKNLKRDAAQIPVPQYFDADLDDFVPLDNGMYIKESQVMIPMELQSKYSTFKQTHAGVTVPITTGNTNTSQYQDLDGFSEVALTMQISATDSCSVEFLWSHDGSTLIATEYALTNASRANGIFRVKRAARYLAVKVWNNGTTAPRTFSTWIELSN